MTLSNIFFGKKVVQQAYLNNALIYQSKGWETLPSTCSEVWTKNYEYSNRIVDAAKDDLDNLYISSENTIYKIDSDGILKWKYTFNISPFTINAIVVSPTYIYCSYNISNTDSNVAKIDTNGNLISDKNAIYFLSGISDKVIFHMENDESNIYAITSNYILKLDFDFNLIEYATTSYTSRSLAVNNGPYVVVGVNGSDYNTLAVRFNKDNLKTKDYIPINVSIAATSIALDKVGHFYLGDNGYFYLYKFDIENCKLITNINLGNTNCSCWDLNVDNQDNLYVIYYNHVNYLLKKYSSDGTLIWDNVQIPAFNASINHIKIVTDNNNNIYVVYIDKDSKLVIKKFINLVKES